MVELKKSGKDGSRRGCGLTSFQRKAVASLMTNQTNKLKGRGIEVLSKKKRVWFLCFVEVLDYFCVFSVEKMRRDPNCDLDEKEKSYSFLDGKRPAYMDQPDDVIDMAAASMFKFWC